MTLNELIEELTCQATRSGAGEWKVRNVVSTFFPQSPDLKYVQFKVRDPEAPKWKLDDSVYVYTEKGQEDAVRRLEKKVEQLESQLAAARKALEGGRG